MSLREEIESAFVGTRSMLFKGAEAFFQGHFPDRPVLPAFVQLMAVRLAVETELEQVIEVTDVSRAVFKNPAAPNQLLELSIRIDGHKVKASIESAGIEISMFTFCFQQVKLSA